MDNRIVFGIVAAAILLIGGYLYFNSGPVVSAQGSAVLKVVPDRVAVYINVDTFNLTAQDAQERNKKISEELLFQLVMAGFNRDELQFVNYNVYPEYDWRNGSQNIKGYRAYQQLVVRTDEISRVPSIVDAAIRSGALVSYINFELSEEKQNEYKRQALEEASKDARLKARSIALGQRKKLGKLVSVGNQDFVYGGPVLAYSKQGVAESMDVVATNSEARSFAANLNPQNMELSAHISVQYRLRRF